MATMTHCHVYDIFILLAFLGMFSHQCTANHRTTQERDIRMTAFRRPNADRAGLIGVVRGQSLARGGVLRPEAAESIWNRLVTLFRRNTGLARLVGRVIALNRARGRSNLRVDFRSNAGRSRDSRMQNSSPVLRVNMGTRSWSDAGRGAQNARSFNANVQLNNDRGTSSITTSFPASQNIQSTSNLINNGNSVFTNTMPAQEQASSRPRVSRSFMRSFETDRRRLLSLPSGQNSRQDLASNLADQISNKIKEKISDEVLKLSIRNILKQLTSGNLERGSSQNINQNNGFDPLVPATTSQLISSPEVIVIDDTLGNGFSSNDLVSLPSDYFKRHGLPDPSSLAPQSAIDPQLVFPNVETRNFGGTIIHIVGNTSQNRVQPITYREQANNLGSVIGTASIGPQTTSQSVQTSLPGSMTITEHALNRRDRLALVLESEHLSSELFGENYVEHLLHDPYFDPFAPQVNASPYGNADQGVLLPTNSNVDILTMDGGLDPTSSIRIVRNHKTTPKARNSGSVAGKPSTSVSSRNSAETTVAPVEEAEYEMEEGMSTTTTTTTTTTQKPNVTRNTKPKPIVTITTPKPRAPS